MKTQSDIARENQEGVEKANKRLAKESGKTEDDRATRFDGAPTQESAGEGVLKPQDDTPLYIKKKDQSEI